MTQINLRRPSDLISTVFGVGLTPVAPGTMGSLVALPPAWLIHATLGPYALAAAAIAVLVIGTWASGETMRRVEAHDPGLIVVDEVVGQWLVLAVAPLSIVGYIAGFVLFRLFDILKPWPISFVDRTLTGGLGVVLDDVLAAGYAAAALVAAFAVLEGGVL